MTDKEVLIAARALIERNWAKGHYAEREDGSQCLVEDEQAAAFCMAGAVERITKGGTVHSRNGRADGLLTDAAHRLFPERFTSSSQLYIHFNDHPRTTKKDVLRVFDAAIGEA